MPTGMEQDEPPWRAAGPTFHQGRLRTIRYTTFHDGTTPGLDFLDGLWKGRRTRKVVFEFLAMFRHLGDNLTHAQFKNWEHSDVQDLRQLSRADYRLILVEETMDKRRVLTLLHGFEKHTRKTPRTAVNRIIDLYTRYQSG